MLSDVFKQLVETVDGYAIFHVDAEGKILTWNQGFGIITRDCSNDREILEWGWTMLCQRHGWSLNRVSEG